MTTPTICPACGRPFSPSNAELVVRNQELERVTKAMDDIRFSYAEHQAWSPSDKIKFRGLRTRRDELRKLLGCVV